MAENMQQTAADIPVPCQFRPSIRAVRNAYGSLQHHGTASVPSTTTQQVADRAAHGDHISAELLAWWATRVVCRQATYRTLIRRSQVAHQRFPDIQCPLLPVSNVTNNIAQLSRPAGRTSCVAFCSTLPAKSATRSDCPIAFSGSDDAFDLNLHFPIKMTTAVCKHGGHCTSHNIFTAL